MKDLSLPRYRYLKVLQRQRDRIISGVELNYFDCTEYGDQDSQVSWGLCSRDKEVWPDPEDHLWPDEFIEKGRVAPKYLEAFDGKPKRCPFDNESKATGTMKDKSLGCFYRCRIFQNKKENQPTREQAIDLYDRMIEKEIKNAEV